MKKFKLILAASLGMALAMPLLTAQETRVTTTTTQGVVSELVPDALVITTDKTPVRYSYTKTTQYVDELGNPVSLELVKSGVPVTVHYVKDASGLVASKVIVRKTTTTTPGGVVGTTTTTTSAPTEIVGTVAEYGNGLVTVRTESSPTPVRYSFTKTTRYIDEDGNTVTAETVRSGAPVKIQYVKRGDQLEAATVIVRKTAVAPAPGTVIKTDKTTTTTTTKKKKDKDDDDDDDDKD